MRRREFIAGLGSTAAWPVAARAQLSTVPVVGYLHAQTQNSAEQSLTEIRHGLAEVGYFEGRNIAIEYRFAENRFDRLPSLAADLVRRGVAVIVAPTATATFAAKAATSTIPIVFLLGGDPVEQFGLVASYNKPGGNLTGATGYSTELWAKRMELMRQLVPSARVFAVLVDPNSVGAPRATRDSQSAARALGRDALILHASSKDDLDAAFAKVVELRSAAFFMQAFLLISWSDYIIALAARHSIPAMYPGAEDTIAGGLVSYGTSRANIAYLLRQTGVYVGRILKGEKAADLPVIQPTRFEFVINLKTARTLGLTVPQTLLALADEVIE